MTSTLSTWAQQFLREDRIAVMSTLNKDGSPHITTIWYLLQEDDTLIMSTPDRTQKVKNLRRDPRIAICVGDETRSISFYGTVTISSDQNVVRRDLEQLAARYIKEEAARAPALSLFMQEGRVALHVKPTKVTEFSIDQYH
jgi:PPOX class probable F420-dependent enzyme